MARLDFALCPRASSRDQDAISDIPFALDRGQSHLAGDIDDVATLLQELHTAGFKGVKMAPSAVTANVVQLAGVAADRLVFPQLAQDFDPENPEISKFVAAFRNKYNRAPEPFAAYGYDAMKVLAEAVRRTKLATAGEVRAQLVNIDHKGVTGEIRFDDRGDVRREPHLHVVVGSEVIHLRGLTRASAPCSCLERGPERSAAPERSPRRRSQAHADKHVVRGARNAVAAAPTGGGVVGVAAKGIGPAQARDQVVGDAPGVVRPADQPAAAEERLVGVQRRKGRYPDTL